MSGMHTFEIRRGQSGAGGGGGGRLLLHRSAGAELAAADALVDAQVVREIM
jgi:hypothetical protein